MDDAFNLPVICEHCDAAHRRHDLKRGQVARCVRCQAVLYRRHWLSLDNMFALALAAAIMFVIANFWPVVTLEMNGQTRSATLLQAVLATWSDGIGIVSVLVAVMLFLCPMLQVLLFTWILGFLRKRQRPPGFTPIMRVLHLIRPWSMIEVFMLGTLVALVKVGSVFEVILQPGIWAFAALTILLALVASFDVRHIWRLKRETCG